MKKIIKIVLDIIIVILIGLIIFLGYRFYEDYFKVKADEQASFNQAVEKFAPDNGEEITIDQETCSDKTINATKNAPQISTDDFGPNEQIGYISAPTIGLEAALIMGDSSDDLHAAMNYGVSIDPAGSMPGNIGNTVIAGHREFAFKALENVAEDTPVIININGNIYTYVVKHHEEIKDTDVDKVFFNDGKERIVLYTCYPFTFNSKVTGRYMVYLEPVESVQINCADLK